MNVVDDVELFEALGQASSARRVHESADLSHFFVLPGTGRIGVVARPSCPPELRGRLPALEYRMFDCILPPTDEAVSFVQLALDSLSPAVAPYVDAVSNPEFDGDVAHVTWALEQAGMSLFQEKHSYHWDDPGIDLVVPDRLEFRTIDEVGEDAFAEIIGRSGEGTLDRNDLWYRDQTGPDNWGRVFLTYLADEHRDGWLVGVDRKGEEVGFISVSDMGPGEPTEWDRLPCATIPMMGVVPEHRGNGYVNDLLAAGTAAAQRMGFVAMLDTVDTLNAPMDVAMMRGDHRRGVRPWHVWHHRAWL